MFDFILKSKVKKFFTNKNIKRKEVKK